MVESSGRPSFVLKSPRGFVRSSADSIKANRFERNLPANRRIERLIHHAHGSMADLAHDLVTPKPFRNHVRHKIESQNDSFRIAQPSPTPIRIVTDPDVRPAFCLSSRP